MSSVGKFQWKTQKTEEKKYNTAAFQHDIPNFNETLICRVLKITKRDVQKSMKICYIVKKKYLINHKPFMNFSLWQFILKLKLKR